MHLIKTLEDLQEAQKLNKEIYTVSCYKTDKGEMKYFNNFRIWTNEDDVMEITWGPTERYRPQKDYLGRSKTLQEWIDSKSLFWSDPIKLELK